MDATLSLLDLAGAVALLLWGVHMVQSGVQRALGPDLRRFLANALGGRIRAAAAGLGVTAVLQSSTATGLMIASFASAGFVGLVPALAAMLGANVGTTLIVQVLSFDVSRLSPLLLVAGVAMFRTASGRTRDVGRVAIGLGLMLIALSRLLDIVTPYEDLPSLRVLMGGIATDRLISVAFGALLAWAAHSSVAVALLVMSFTEKGVVPLDAALALMIGANIGTALNPLLEGARGGDAAGRRVVVGNVVTRLAGAAVALPLLTPIGIQLVQIEPSFSRAVADFHTAFNLVVALAFLPLLGPLARLLERLMPARVSPADPSRPLYLDEAALETPSLALGHAAREALRMVDMLDSMIEAAADALRDGDREAMARARRQDDILDALNGEIKRYLTRLDPESLTDEEHRRIEAVLTFCLNLEAAGDVVERNISGFVARLLKRGVALAPENERAVQDALAAVRANLRSAASVFTTGDRRAARVLSQQKAEFRRREAEAVRSHFAELRSGDVGPRAAPLDLLRDIKRLNDHLVAGAAYPVLEAAGELMQTRIAEDSGPGTG
ncbi:phosphate:Na+ symporter [Roseiarcus fermentans]|uniref:Phosphate:Na+ symporter n=1 Tax=Roseiarcus fermentans TaxID=1473586 RepID=A0A366FMF5_9HYPH|nr:Na/Pi cotransporter family protein [Roseiarcus fermentans]RBP15751.1 phosphate:Na+ symporter [Roseiarcus fermentans]